MCVCVRARVRMCEYVGVWSVHLCAHARICIHMCSREMTHRCRDETHRHCASHQMPAWLCALGGRGDGGLAPAECDERLCDALAERFSGAGGHEGEGWAMLNECPVDQVVRGWSLSGTCRRGGGILVRRGLLPCLSVQELGCPGPVAGNNEGRLGRGEGEEVVEEEAWGWDGGMAALASCVVSVRLVKGLTSQGVISALRYLYCPNPCTTRAQTVHAWCGLHVTNICCHVCMTVPFSI